MKGLRGALLAVTATVIAGAAIFGGVALAQTPTPSVVPGQGQGQQNGLKDFFLDQLAKNLNVSRSQLETAIKGAGNSTVDEALRQGKVNQDQATKLHERINQGNGFFGGMMGHFGERNGMRGQGGPGGPGGQGGNILNAIATQLKIDPQTLMSQLRAGKTLKEIAAAANPPVTDLNTLKPGLKTAIQAELKQKGVSQEKIDQAVQRIDSLDLNQFGTHQGRPGGPRQGN